MEIWFENHGHGICSECEKESHDLQIPINKFGPENGPMCHKCILDFYGKTMTHKEAGNEIYNQQ